jgi:hypothetical protein
MELLDVLGVSAWPDVHAKLVRDKDLVRLRAYAEASAQSNACHEAWMKFDKDPEEPKERSQAAQEALIAYRVSESRNQAAKLVLWTVLYTDQEPREYQDDEEGEAFDQMIQDDLDGRFD